MIPRYSNPEMIKIWSDFNKYDIWFKIEIEACKAMERLGNVPLGTAEKILAKKNFAWNPARIDEIEAVTKHDVIAFLTFVSENVGDEAKYLHLGLTSSDVLDTCLGMQMKESGELILKQIDLLLESLKEKALNYKNDPCVGRSHGIHAEPITIGLKFARFFAEFERAKQRLELAIKEISVVAISGAVGTFANVDPFVQEFVAKELGLAEETISTQVIPRDRHAMFFTTLAIIASSIENIAVEIRHMQRTEVLEAEETFSKGQKGSSAMPHKRNPVLSENLTGLARLVRSAVMPALENVALWHERDISHSAVERGIAPDTCIHLYFALKRLTGLVSNLTIYKENALENLNKLKGLVFSQRVLLSLIEEAKISREEAYKIVQETAMKIWNRETNKDFNALLKENELVSSKLSNEKIDSLFDISYHTKNIDKIYSKVFIR
jgi:adenylosuccinate lyase